MGSKGWRIKLLLSEEQQPTSSLRSNGEATAINHIAVSFSFLGSPNQDPSMYGARGEDVGKRFLVQIEARRFTCKKSYLVKIETSETGK